MWHVVGGAGAQAAGSPSAAQLRTQTPTPGPSVPLATHTQEVHYSGRMAQIRALNLALQWGMTPVVTFVTFAVYRGIHGHLLPLPSVFYVLS